MARDGLYGRVRSGSLLELALIVFERRERGLRAFALQAIVAAPNAKDPAKIIKSIEQIYDPGAKDREAKRNEAILDTLKRAQNFDWSKRLRVDPQALRAAEDKREAAKNPFYKPGLGR